MSTMEVRDGLLHCNGNVGAIMYLNHSLCLLVLGNADIIATGSVSSLLYIIGLARLSSDAFHGARKSYLFFV